jgi:hypothetical protein
MANIVLTYTVQKVVSIDDIPDFTLSKNEIESKIYELQLNNEPEGFEVTECDYSYPGQSREPLAKGCEPLPTENCWVDLDGIGKIATNGWALVTPDCPSVNEGNCSNEWYPVEKAQKTLISFFNENSCGDQLHPGYFHQRFLPLKSIPDLKVYGENAKDPGFCYVENKLIAVIMPTVVRHLTCLDDKLFKFESC